MGGLIALAIVGAIAYLALAPGAWQSFKVDILKIPPTLADVSACINRSKESNVSLKDQIIVAQCREKYSSMLNSEVVTKIEGRMGPSKLYSTNYFSGSIHNKSNDWIITELQFSIRNNPEVHAETFGKYVSVSNLWIQPNSSESVWSAALDDKFVENIWHTDGKFSFIWSIWAAKGIKVEIR